jgi:hypothetical protein
LSVVARTYAQYRDLGIVEASNGMVRAHVLRFTAPCDPKEVSKWMPGIKPGMTDQ